MFIIFYLGHICVCGGVGGSKCLSPTGVILGFLSRRGIKNFEWGALKIFGKKMGLKGLKSSFFLVKISLFEAKRCGGGAP